MRASLTMVSTVVMFISGAVIQADEPKEFTTEDVIQKEGTIVSIKVMKGGRRELSVKVSEEISPFIIDRTTMAYNLTARNRKIFAEQDKIDQIVKDANQYRRRAIELKEGEMDVALAALGLQHGSEFVSGHAQEKSERGAKSRSIVKSRNELGALTQSQEYFLREEEERRKKYGPHVKLKPRQKVLVVASKDGDDTLAVLVTGDEPEPKITAKESPGVEREAEAGRKLKYAKQTLKDAEAAKGDERDHLFELAQKKLQEVVDKYEGSKAAKEAQDLLDKK